MVSMTPTNAADPMVAIAFMVHSFYQPEGLSGDLYYLHFTSDMSVAQPPA